MEDFNFNSNVVYENLESLMQQYPFLQTGSAGKSILDKNIPYVRVGRGQKEVFYSASIHANERINQYHLSFFKEKLVRFSYPIIKSTCLCSFLI